MRCRASCRGPERLGIELTGVSGGHEGSSVSAFHRPRWPYDGGCVCRGLVLSDDICKFIRFHSYIGSWTLKDIYIYMFDVLILRSLYEFGTPGK